MGEQCLAHIYFYSDFNVNSMTKKLNGSKLGLQKTYGTIIFIYDHLL